MGEAARDHLQQQYRPKEFLFVIKDIKSEHSAYTPKIFVEIFIGQIKSLELLAIPWGTLKTSPVCHLPQIFPISESLHIAPNILVLPAMGLPL